MYFSTLKTVGLSFLLEICVDSVESACNAEEAGAGRVELCSALSEGGLTPSLGLISMVRSNINIDLNVLIRPRRGDFLYSDQEFSVMKHDIDVAGEAGANGIVTGILLSNGSIDTERMSKLVEYAWPMKVTFHRAFDMCHDPFGALEEIVSTGASRLLTSGQARRAVEGVKLIKDLITIADDNIIIMPGAGIDEFNISSIALATGAREFHLSAGTRVESNMAYRKKGVVMGSMTPVTEYEYKTADIHRIKTAIKTLQSIEIQ